MHLFNMKMRRIFYKNEKSHDGFYRQYVPKRKKKTFFFVKGHLMKPTEDYKMTIFGRH